MGRKKIFSNEKMLQAINELVLRNGLPPTIEELRDYLGIGSTRTILRYLDWLVEDGTIERWKGARGLRVIRSPHKGLETSAIPIIGEVPAGLFMLAEENLEGWVKLPNDFLRSSGNKYFLLRVRGDSMDRAKLDGVRIEDGDLILVEQQPIANSGDIIVALIDGEATIKRLGEGVGYYLLKPESSNPMHKPILVTQEFRVAGVVRRVFKKGSTLLNSEN